MSYEDDENEGFPHRNRDAFEYEAFPGFKFNLVGNFFSVSVVQNGEGTIFSKTVPQENLWQAKDFFDALERL